MKLTKRLRKYLRDLFILGVVGVLSGVFFMVLVLQPNNPGDWVIYYFPLKIICISVTYLLINHIVPGGNVNYYFARVHEPNDDEILLNRLIAKYRNKIFVAIPGIVYILVDIVLGISRYNTNYTIDLDGVFFYSFFPFFFVGAMMTGLKYSSAWWNIQRVLRKDPSGELLIASVSNDPNLAKLDNPKPIINLPKLIKQGISFLGNLLGIKK